MQSQPQTMIKVLYVIAIYYSLFKNHCHLWNDFMLMISTVLGENMSHFKLNL